MSRKIISVSGQGTILKAEWNILIHAFFDPKSVRTKRYVFSDITIATVLSDLTKGLGIRLVNPIKSGNINSMIELGIYDGTNECDFDGIIMSERLNEIYTDPHSAKIAFSIGLDSSTGNLIVLCDNVRPNGKLGGGGDGGNNLTPCKIPS